MLFADKLALLKRLNIGGEALEIEDRVPGEKRG
jgi:hypothetical protein